MKDENKQFARIMVEKYPTHLLTFRYYAHIHINNYYMRKHKPEKEKKKIKNAQSNGVLHYIFFLHTQDRIVTKIPNPSATIADMIENAFPARVVSSLTIFR